MTDSEQQDTLMDISEKQTNTIDHISPKPGQPITTEADYQKMMNEISSALDVSFNGVNSEKKVGFALFLFELATPGSNIRYSSNCNREDVVQAIRPLVMQNIKNRKKRIVKK